jgi:hypothetical protein
MRPLPLMLWARVDETRYVASVVSCNDINVIYYLMKTNYTPWSLIQGPDRSYLLWVFPYTKAECIYWWHSLTSLSLKFKGILEIIQINGSNFFDPAVLHFSQLACLARFSCLETKQI